MDISGNNRYELLFMDDDSGALPEQKQSAASKKKQNNPPAKKSPSLTKKNNIEKENKSGTLNRNDTSNTKSTAGTTKAAGDGNMNKTRSDGKQRRVAFKSPSNEVREERHNERNFRGSEFGSEPRQVRERDNRGTTRNREGTFRGGKREFDRQSGSAKTGVKAVDKRNGAGAHNWGSVKEEIDDGNKSTTDADAALTDKEESSNEQTPENPVAVEEEVKELTLDEWKALRGERTKPQYNIRKPNEGEDTSEWKKMVVLNKKKEGGESEDEYEYDPSMYPQRVGRLQRIVDIQFNFNDGRRGFGRFGSGRGRGARSVSDNKALPPDINRQPRQKQAFGGRQKRSTRNVLKVDDEQQFPTLS